jgi:hypothetical protein
MVVLEREEEFSLQTRNKIDDLVGSFLRKVENDIHGMLCGNDLENYRGGLDSDQDTEELLVLRSLSASPILLLVPEQPQKGRIIIQIFLNFIFSLFKIV